ncbi:hypothetical protein [Anaplasma phagocytophilum]|uniref:hypothetical protein n=1 Tax=Anaplasma phagocytophilum TaxID=948 RepID=UPI00200CF7FA|nr:hypothetical protein [Anaplasma phagocytophilum]UQD54078.1 hypothetical protein ESP60_01145 [Anaplasma phagocytophilum]
MAKMDVGVVAVVTRWLRKKGLRQKLLVYPHPSILEKMSKLGLSRSLDDRWFDPDASQNVLEDVVVSQSMGPRCHSSGAF